MNSIKISLVIFCGALIVSCGGGGSGSSTPAATSYTISGNVVKGPIIGASVTFFALNADGSKGTQLGTTTTDANGNYNVNLTPAPSTPFLAEALGGTYVDEATGATTTLLATDKINAALPAGTTNATVTPLTHIAASRALALAASGTAIATAVDSSNNGVASQYGLADIVTVLPPAANNAIGMSTATQAEKDYALVLAGIAQLANSVGVRAIDLAVALAEDAKDGILNGKNSATAINVPIIAGGSFPLPVTAGTTDVQTAINTFIASVNNKTGITQPNNSSSPVIIGGNSSSGAPVITPPSIPKISEGTGGSFTVIANCGSLPCYFAFDTFANGTPPLGASVGLASGAVSIPATAKAGSYNFGVCAIDVGGRSSCTNIPLTITYKGTLSGTYSGSGTGITVNGTFSIAITDGLITGSYSATVTSANPPSTSTISGLITGTVDATGKFSAAAGGASGGSWSGSITKTGQMLSGNGSWAGAVSSGSWDGAGTSQ